MTRTVPADALALVLRSARGRLDATTHAAVVLDPLDDTDRLLLRELAGDQDVEVHDTVTDQLAELVRTRAPWA